MKKDVVIWTGAGQIGMAIARRVGYGKKLLVGDKSLGNAEAISRIMNQAGFDCEPFEMDLSERESILSMIARAQELGPITTLINAAGVSPSQAPIEAILKVDLYGTAVLLEEVGKVIEPGGVGVTILGTQISTAVNSTGKPHELILGGTTNNYTFYDTADSVYIGLNSNGNALHQLTSNTEQGAHWTITLSNGVCDILNNGYEDRYLRYNNSSPRFACYTSGQYPVVLYKRAATTGIVASQWLTSEREEQVLVYSIDGRRVCSANNKKDALRQLTKGIYIVNGRKMVVK
jgi:hypothetical protein